MRACCAQSRACALLVEPLRRLRHPLLDRLPNRPSPRHRRLPGPDATALAYALLAHLRAALPPYQVPAAIWLLERCAPQ